MDTAYRRAVGKRIRVWRVLHERSQDELAAEAGINLMAIPVIAISALFARGYVRGLTAAMLEGS